MGNDVRTEIWRNDSKGVVQVKKLGPNGRLEPVLVQPGRSFDMTSEERKLNQMEIATAADDPWTNDLFGRVGAIDSIVESNPDKEIASTPERVSADDLFGLGIPDLKERVAEITNPATLRAIYESGVRSEARPAKLAVVEARVREIDADADYLPAPAPAATPPATPERTPASNDSDAKSVKAPTGTRPARP